MTQTIIYRKPAREEGRKNEGHGGEWGGGAGRDSPPGSGQPASDGK